MATAFDAINGGSRGGFRGTENLVTMSQIRALLALAAGLAGGLAQGWLIVRLRLGSVGVTLASVWLAAVAGVSLQWLIAAPIIINQPQSAILGVGKLEKRVVVREINGQDAILVRPMAYVTLTIDHRVVDGHQTNAWLSRFVELLESWPAA